MSVPYTHHRWTLEDWDRMIAAGVFREGERVELIEGEVLEMTPAGDRHVWVMAWLARAWSGLPSCESVQIMQQVPLRLGSDSEPEPDVLILKPVEEWSASGKPRAGDVHLLVEIADTSLEYDMNKKVPLYARHGIPEVWVVDLTGRRVHVFRNPEDGKYRQADVHSTGRIAPAAFPDAEIDVGAMLAG